MLAIGRAWRARNTEKTRAYKQSRSRKVKCCRLQRLYGITLEEYEAGVAAQGNVCSICSCPGPEAPGGQLVVDHCHGGGHVRGFLCNRCNVALGLMRDSPSFLIAAAQYLLTTAVSQPTGDTSRNSSNTRGS